MGRFADMDAEFDEFLKNFDSWQATVKGADHNLQGLQQSKGTDGSNLQFTYESVICFSRCCAVTT